MVDHGFAARYASVRRFVRQLPARTPVDARVVITAAPGSGWAAEGIERGPADIQCSTAPGTRRQPREAA